MSTHSPDPPKRRYQVAEAPRLKGRLLEGRYRVGAELERGGMGVVHRGWDSLLDRAIAVKFSLGVRDPRMLAARLRNEARALAKLHDPRPLAPVTFGLTEERLAYVVVELLEGGGLDKLIRALGPLPTRTTLQILLELACGLEEVHAAGVVHRDIKPGNVFLQRTLAERVRVRLLDFGMARLPEAEAEGLTRPGQALGTPGFMAPEQYRGSVDARTDLYSLGVLGYACLMGKSPYPGSKEEKAHLQQYRPLPPVDRLTGSTVDPATANLLFRMTRIAPVERPQTAREVRDELERILGSDREVVFDDGEVTRILTRVTVPGVPSAVPEPDGSSRYGAEAPRASLGWRWWWVFRPEGGIRRKHVFAAMLGALAAVVVAVGWVAATSGVERRAASPEPTAIAPAQPLTEVVVKVRDVAQPPSSPSPPKGELASDGGRPSRSPSAPERLPTPAVESSPAPDPDPEVEGCSVPAAGRAKLLGRLRSTIGRVPAERRALYESCLGQLESTMLRYPGQFEAKCRRCLEQR